MTQPTKEQVLKRMAEIEGIYCRWNQSGEGEYVPGWNPLDTPSDWAVLIEKYQPTMSHYDNHIRGGSWHVAIRSGVSSFSHVAVHESLPWAICLAIIESKGGMGDE